MVFLRIVPTVLTGVFPMVGNVGRVGLAAVAVWLTVGMGVVAAQDRRQNESGQFDYYVLSLSWSPTFCEASGERGTPPQQQCGARSWCTGFGRNTRRDSRNSASSRRRGSTAISSPRCSI